MAHKEYTVKQGDCIQSIAYERGLFWETVWDDPKNAELKRTRKNPSALLPGDKVYICDKEEREVPGACEQRHRFRRKGVPALLRIQLYDSQDKPRANEPYILSIDGELRRGQTDGNGFVEQTVPPGAQKGTLTVGEGEDQDEYELELRCLDPADQISGAQGRLNNLGYDAGEANGLLTAETQDALSQFQRDYGLPVTGQLDKETAKKIEEVYDG